MRSFGIDYNYDGEPVGLWFDPEMVEKDEYGRVFMTAEEMECLTGYLDSEFKDRDA